MPNIKIERCDRYFKRIAMQGSPNDAELDIETVFYASPEQTLV